MLPPYYFNHIPKRVKGRDIFCFLKSEDIKLFFKCETSYSESTLYHDSDRFCCSETDPHNCTDLSRQKIVNPLQYHDYKGFFQRKMPYKPAPPTQMNIITAQTVRYGNPSLGLGDSGRRDGCAEKRDV